MTDDQKRVIREQRLAGESYATIAAMLGLSASTIKSYCSRYMITHDTATNTSAGHCKQCGVSISCTLEHRPKLFCSEACRQKWWRVHKGEVTTTKSTSVCAHCGTTFKNGGNPDPRFCSHPCYIEHRFGGRAKHA